MSSGTVFAVRGAMLCGLFSAAFACLAWCVSCGQEPPVDVDRLIAESNQYTPLHMAVYKCDMALVEKIIKSGAADLEAKAIWDETPLHLAARRRDCAGIIPLLVKRGANVEAVGIHKTRPLHNAAVEGDVENVRALAEAGADINASGGAVICGNCYRTPLEAALGAKKTASVLYLISRGARIDTVAHYSVSPDYYISWAMKHTTRASRTVHGSPARFHHDEYSPLQAAAVLGELEVVAALLKRGTNVNHNPGRGASTLALAAWQGHGRIVDLLLEKGARPDVADSLGRTALHFALENRKNDIALKLVNAGADVNVKDLYGGTPLHVAARNGDREIVELLLAKGARRDARDSNGKTPGECAADRGVRELLK